MRRASIYPDRALSPARADAQHRRAPAAPLPPPRRKIPPPALRCAQKPAGGAALPQQAAAVEESPDWAVTHRAHRKLRRVPLKWMPRAAFDNEWNTSAQGDGDSSSMPSGGLILTNRHASHPGPVTVDGDFSQPEEVAALSGLFAILCTISAYSYGSPARHTHFISPRPAAAVSGRAHRSGARSAWSATMPGEQLSILAWHAGASRPRRARVWRRQI